MLAYLVVCWLAVAWVPIVTVWRLVQTKPRGETKSEVVDVQRLVGKPLLGNGHHGFLGRFPRNEIFTVEYVERTGHEAPGVHS